MTGEGGVGKDTDWLPHSPHWGTAAQLKWWGEKQPQRSSDSQELAHYHSCFKTRRKGLSKKNHKTKPVESRYSWGEPSVGGCSLVLLAEA